MVSYLAITLCKQWSGYKLADPLFWPSSPTVAKLRTRKGRG